MLKKLAVLVLGVVFVITILGGFWSMAYSQPRNGFADIGYVKPMSSGPLPQESVPNYTASIHGSPDISIQFSLGHFYEDYGSVISLIASNDGSRQTYLTAFAFEWTDSGQMFEKYINVSMSPGDTAELGILRIDGPGSTGDHEYRILVQGIERRGSAYYKLTTSTGDWIPFEPGMITVIDEGIETEYDYRINYHLYFDKANEIVTPDSPSIEYQASLATAHLGPGYKMSKLAAIFDHVDTILTYRLEPEDTDYWQTPEECLSTKTGDCEDYSLLIASMVLEIGGTPRLYLIDGHAFAAVYVGDTPADLESAKASISAYYNADLRIYHLEDETGYWVIADPLGSFYFGGSSVGAVPISGGENWQWTFNDTSMVHAIDITGEIPSTPVYYNVVFWMYMMFFTGITLIGVSTYVSRKEASGTNCALCNQTIEEAPVTCTNCQTGLHMTCFSGGQCPKCGGTLALPPPSSARPPSQPPPPGDNSFPPPPPPPTGE